MMQAIDIPTIIALKNQHIKQSPPYKLMGSLLTSQLGDRVMDEGVVDIIMTPDDATADEWAIPSAEMLRRCQATQHGTTNDLWGAHIRASTVTLFVGETSAGKTVFLHNLAYHLAMGKEFLGLTPPRPLRVLYVDYESTDEIRSENLSAIGDAPGWNFFSQYDVDPGKPLMAQLQETVQSGRYDIVIVDPLMEAYPVVDENSNTEAIKQMLVFRRLARTTGAAVVVVHNSGQRRRGKADDKFSARGATSRVDRADVSINFTSVKDAPTLRVLYVTKSRSSNLNESMVVKFSDELGYALVSATGPEQSVVTEWQAKIVKYVQQRAQQHKGPFASAVLRSEMLDHFKITEDMKELLTLNRALRNCVVDGTLYKPKKGTYAIPSRKEMAQ